MTKAITTVAALQLVEQEKVDLETISKIRYEGFHNSKIMEIASGLMDGIGQRLTGSPNVKRANEWTRDKLTEFGLVNAHLEPWTPFGRGWSNQYVNVRLVLGHDPHALVVPASAIQRSHKPPCMMLCENISATTTGTATMRP